MRYSLGIMIRLVSSTILPTLYREEDEPILSEAAKPQPEPELELFRQFARIDEGFLAWDFRATDSQGDEIASIKRAFRGFGLEVFIFAF